MNPRTFSVWVGAAEVVDYLHHRDEAERIADYWRGQGYDDVAVGEYLAGGGVGWADQSVTPPASGVVLDEWGALHCQCGNLPDFDGFTACDAQGVHDDDLLRADAVGLHYLCERCGLVVGPWPSLRVVAVVEVFGGRQ